jgi:hypothetical protein
MRSFYYQQGSTPDLRVSDENKWYVSYEDWQGNSIVNKGIVSSHSTEVEAIAARKQAEKNYVKPKI